MVIRLFVVFLITASFAFGSAKSSEFDRYFSEIGTVSVRSLEMAPDRASGFL